MYVIYADDICIYNDAFSLEDMKLISPKLVLEDNAAGTLTMTVPASNRGYSLIKRMATDIFVLKDGEEIWRGRVLSEAEDFYRIGYCRAKANSHFLMTVPSRRIGTTVRLSESM